MSCVTTAYAQGTEGIYSSEIKEGVSLYVITNRVADEDPGSPYYINEIKSEGPLTIMRVSIIEGDSLDITPFDTESLVSTIKQDDNDWLLFVHGDSKTFEQAVMRGFDIQHLHQVNVIVFSWPSRNPEINGIKNFKNSKKNVVMSMDHFRELLTIMKNIRLQGPFETTGTNFSIFIHSLGNYYLENLVKDIAFSGYEIPIFDNMIINAAAVNQDGHALWVEQLDMQRRIYITCNKQDFNLKGVRIFTKDGKQLGEKVTLPLADNAEYVHFTEAIGFRFPTGTTHTYFIGEVPEKSMNINIFFKEILHGWAIDLDEKEMFIKREDDLGYDIIF